MQRWAIGVLAVMTLSAVARAQSVERGNWELTLAGVGSSNKDFDSHAIGANVGVGYFPLDFLELGLRQTITYVDNADTSSTDASTTLALDIHLPLGDRGRIVPFIGEPWATTTATRSATASNTARKRASSGSSTTRPSCSFAWNIRSSATTFSAPASRPISSGCTGWALAYGSKPLTPAGPGVSDWGWGLPFPANLR